MGHCCRLGHLLRSNAPHFTSLVSVALHCYPQEVVVSNSSLSRSYLRTSFNSSLPSLDGYPIHYLHSLPHRLPYLWGLLSPSLEKNYFKSPNTLGNDCKYLYCLQKTRMKLHLAIEDTVLMLLAKEIKLICLVFLDFERKFLSFQ